jgi:uncharacterized protein with NRDE domain
LCTLIILYKLLDDYPILAMHNRYLSKDTKEYPPNNLNGIFCPIDISSCGTWFGFNENGLLLGITNQETEKLDNPGRSRGLLALDILDKFTDAEEAKDFLLDPDTRLPYRRGNFLIADKKKGWHIVWDREVFSFPIENGCYPIATLTKLHDFQLDENGEKIYQDASKRLKRAKSLLGGYKPRNIDDVINKLMQVSADHGYGKSQASICWHSQSYKQTSSTIIAIGSNVKKSRIYYCEGNSCENEFVDYSKIIK